MFLAAFTSRSCTDPQLLQTHSLIRKPALPFGLLSGLQPQHEQVWVKNNYHCLRHSRWALQLLKSASGLFMDLGKTPCFEVSGLQ